MKVKGMDLGVCGVEQLIYAGSVAYDTEDVDKGVALCELPANIVVTRAIAVVKTAFNAGTTNVLTVGANDDVNDIMGTSDITEGTAGNYIVNKFVEYKAKKTVKVKYTQTGTDASTGAADIYLSVVRIPE
ncbi:MAG: hypothetical protein K6G60_10555 [Lachnospiraceae bacterium]|nr:hypothetical protein [Lachnospiraceae bacterium]